MRPETASLVADADLAAALALVRRHAPPAPLQELPAVDGLGDAGGVRVQREDLGPCGVFKWRGALAALAGGSGTAVAASTGNHGLGLAWAGRQLGRAVEILVPRDANPDKVARIRAEGATLVHDGADLDEAIAAARRRAAGDAEAELVVDGEHPGIFPGTATIGAEIADRLPGVERVVVPVGNGALVTGVALGLWRRGCTPQIVGVGAAGAPFMYESWRRRRPFDSDRCETIADGLAGRVALRPATDAMIDLVDEFRLVDDDALRRLVVAWFQATREVIEPSAAAGLAALSSLPAGPTTCVVVTGRNIDPGLRLELELVTEV